MTASDHDRQTRVDRLTAAARQRTQRAEQQAEKTIRHMLRDRQAVTFRAVHRRSGLSLDFLYSNANIRARIEAARDTHTNAAPSPPQTTTPRSADGTVIRILTVQLQAAKRQHHNDTVALRRQLAAATGEVLALRECLRARETR